MSPDRRRWVRVVFIILGHLFTGLAVLGAILPLVPTTPFLLAAAACYSRGSQRFYNWLFTNRWFGHYLSDYKSGRGISLQVKIVALLFMWPPVLFSVIFIVPYLAVQIGMILLSLAISIHILWIKTKKKQE